MMVRALLVFLVFASACDRAPEKETMREAGYQAALEKAVAENDAILNASAAVRIADEGFAWRGGTGEADPASGEAMTGDHIIRTASVTKAFAATTALRMVEEGKFDLDAPLSDLLDDEDVPGENAVADFYVLDGEPMADRITLRQLLSHTSGIPDQHFAVSPVTGTSLAGDYVDRMMDGDVSDVPTKIWTRDELVRRFFGAGLNTTPLFPIGEGYEYSDTNYLILSLILEKAGNAPMQELYERYIFEKADLNHTFLETGEAMPVAGRRAHHYWLVDPENGVNVDLTALTGVASLDFGSPGSGGLSSTPDDLARFIEALMEGALFERAETLTAMRTPSENSLNHPSETSFHKVYGLGLGRFDLPSGRQVYGHCGYWGVCTAYDPEEGVSIAIAINQTVAHGEIIYSLLDELLAISLER